MMGNMQKKVSVVMSCYNSQEWLADSIESVLSQTYEDFEFVLVDDGSQDSTPHIISRYRKLDSRIKVISKKNTGLPDSLNVGISEASGEWIARLDADDTCEPDRLEKQIEFVAVNPQVVLLGTSYSEVDTNGNVLKIHSYPNDDRILKYNLQRLRQFLHHSSVLYPAGAVKRVGGYRPRIRLAEDLDLWLRLASRGQFACLGEPLVHVRTHPNQISHAASGKSQLTDGMIAIISHLLTIDSVEDPVEIEDNHAWQFFREWVEMKIDEEGIFRRRKSWICARESYLRQSDKVSACSAFIDKFLETSPLSDLFFIVRERFLGSSVPIRLMLQWKKLMIDSRLNDNE
jgi:glycosyltransferase involved in cell wall biosynthesis